MKISSNSKILAITAVVSAASLFAAITTNLNAGQGNYGNYRSYGYDTGYQPPAPPGYRYYAPGMPHRMQGYSRPTPAYPATDASANNTGPMSAVKNIAISGMQFQPAMIRVKTGDQVTWMNSESMPHTLTSRDSGTLASARLNRGSTFSHTFEQPGTYTYYCALHPSMTGIVIVE